MCVFSGLFGGGQRAPRAAAPRIAPAPPPPPRLTTPEEDALKSNSANQMKQNRTGLDALRIDLNTSGMPANGLRIPM